MQTLVKKRLKNGAELLKIYSEGAVHVFLRRAQTCELKGLQTCLTGLTVALLYTLLTRSYKILTKCFQR